MKYLLAIVLLLFSQIQVRADDFVRQSLGAPNDGSIVSGASVILGWHCDSKNIEVFIDGVSIGMAGAGTTIVSMAAPDRCGHSDVGWSLLYNFNNLTPGQHVVTATADGVLFGSNTFYTLRLDGVNSWLDGLKKQLVVHEFPYPGFNSTLTWYQSYQNFVITKVDTNSPIEGVYEGITTDGLYTISLVLENNQFWSMYVDENSNSFGLLQGQLSTSDGTCSSVNLRDFGVYPVASGTASCGYNPGVSISGNTTFPGSASTFLNSIVSTDYFDYLKPASVSDIEGDWDIVGSDGLAASLTIASSGSFNGYASNGCNFNGQLTPRASGKNVFDMSATFGPSPCALPNTSISGVAVDLLSEGQTALMIGGVNSSRTAGGVYLGIR